MLSVTKGRVRRRQRSVGIALGAGGARGLAHIGVLQAIAHAGIRIDAIVGTSSGALVGAIYAAGQLETFEREVRRLHWKDALSLFDPVWPRSGLLSGTRILERLAGSLGDWRIEDLALPFAAVSVDLVTGEEILIREGRVIDAIRASVSVPGIFVPVRQGRRLLVDGALRNPVPVSCLAEFGSDVIVAVNLQGKPVREIVSLSRRPDATPRKTVAARVTEAIDTRLRRFRRRPAEPREPDPVSDESVPNLFEILTASMSILEYELAQHRLAREHVDVRIEPDVHSIRNHEFHRAAQAIEAGLAAGEEALPALRRALKRPRLLRRARS